MFIYGRIAGKNDSSFWTNDKCWFRSIIIYFDDSSNSFDGAIVGAINGLGVQVLKVVPLVMTLIMSNVVNGFSIMVTKGQPSVMVGKELQGISKTLVGPFRILPTVVIVVLILLEVFS